MRFSEIRKSEHYKEFHEQEVPWYEVVQVIMQYDFRKKGDCYEIESDKYYILCRLEEKILWVVNAKRK